MKQGDFTECAASYINRTGYADDVLDLLIRHIEPGQRIPVVAEIGAGTGKLTKQLLERNLKVIAVEPNDAMRAEGIKYTQGHEVIWQKGFGEETGLETNYFDWVIMASSFHWTDPKKSLPEFSRILKTGGYFTALWNPRNLEASELHTQIEASIYHLVPTLERKSSGSAKYTQGIEKTLVSTGHFSRPIFIEATHEEIMSKQRYMAAWASVNDIQAQAGPQKWTEILETIEAQIAGLQEIIVPYKTRSWTSRKILP